MVLQLGFGQESKSLSPYKVACYEIYTRSGRLNSSGLGQDSVATSDYMNVGEFLYQLSDRKLFKKASASLSFSSKLTLSNLVLRFHFLTI
jgi:hypothetical protein